MVSLRPNTDLEILNSILSYNLGQTYTPAATLDLSNYIAGFFKAMKHYHGSNRSDAIADPPFDLYEISESIGVPVDAYRPEKSSANRLSWTIRLWERTAI